MVNDTTMKKEQPASTEKDLDDSVPTNSNRVPNVVGVNILLMMHRLMTAFMA